MRAAVRSAAAVLVLWAMASTPTFAGPRDPITGDAFQALVAAQDLPLQEFLRDIFSERDGCHVIGPLDPLWLGKEDTASLFRMVRVLCVDGDAMENALATFDDIEGMERIEQFDEHALDSPAGFRGAIVTANLEGRERRILFTTAQQTRWLIWLHDAWTVDPAAAVVDSFDEYAREVSNHLRSVEAGEASDEPPDAASFGLPAALSLYAPRPDYVIQGYANYKGYLFDHEEIRTSFAHAITAFVPTDSLLNAWKSDPPQVAYPNKEAPLVQHEFRKFFERGGNIGVVNTLTREVLRMLEPGEYFFAVGMSGRIRFGFEMPREEVERVERESGRRIPRANHAYLFPGETVLTAGAFFVEDDGEARIVAVNAQSGHYFYSNVTPSVREDIAERSNDYLLTLAHFFRALDREGISGHRVLISKL